MQYKNHSALSNQNLPIRREVSMRKTHPTSDMAPAQHEPGKLSKYREVIVFFENAIAQGKYREGEKLPSELEIARQFDLSRPTVSKAMRELQLGGAVERRMGSGSYVRRSKASSKRVVLGLLIPNIGEQEIFESISGQIAREAQARGYDLVLPKLLNDRKRLVAEEICEPYLAKEIAGVFFAPLELNQVQDAINHQIAAIFDAAGSPLVLIDRDLEPYPARSTHDLIGIDNCAAGDMLARHLIACGCRSLAFVAHPLSAATIPPRSAGILGALHAAGLQPAKGFSFLIDPSDPSQVKTMLASAKPDGIICANDRTAAELMQSLHVLNVKVPHDVSVAGIDDVRYAKLLQPALTTIHQPCQLIGTVALQAMLERIADPTIPPRHIMLPVQVVVRQSSRLPQA